MSLPAWFAQLAWNGPYTVQHLNNGNRDAIPRAPGCYVFTSTPGEARPTQTLYVGQAVDLRRRLPSYLIDYTRPKQRETHKGKSFLLEHRSQNGDHGLFVRWAEYAGDLNILEASLMNFLNPMFNSRDDDTFHPLFDDDELLDPRLIG